MSDKTAVVREATNQKSFDADAPHGLAHRTFTGIVWMLSASGLQALLRIGILAILARLLTQEEFGLANAGLTIVSFATIISQLGLNRAIVQRPELTEAHLRTAATVFTFTSTVMGVAMVVAAPQIASLLRMDALTPVIRVIALSFPLQGMVIVPAALLQRRLHFRRFASINVLSYLGGFGVVGIALALAGMGGRALIGASLAQALILTGCVLAVQPFPKRPLIDRAALGELVYYGGGHTIARLLNQTGGEADNLIVGRWLGAEALGVYGRAYQMLVFPVNLFSGVLNNVLFPSFSKLQDDIPRLGRAYRHAVAATSLAYLPLSVALVVLAPELVAVLLGPNWTDVVLPFQILAAGLLFRGSKVNLAVAHATGAVYSRAWREGIFGVLVVAGALIGLRWGVAGVAAGVLIALFVSYMLMTQLVLSLTAVSWRDYLATNAPAARVAAVTLAATWPLTNLLRGWNTPPLLTVFGAGALAAGVLLVLAYLLPRQFLGDEGLWMFDTVLRFLPRRVSAPLASLRAGRHNNAIS